jgi:hypothetical protein
VDEVLPSEFLAVTKTVRYLPSSESFTLYVELVAPLNFLHPMLLVIDVAPAGTADEQLYQARDIAALGVAAHVPSVARRSLPVEAVPETLGADFSAGGNFTYIDLAVDEVLPSEFLAVTKTVRYLP